MDYDFLDKFIDDCGSEFLYPYILADNRGEAVKIALVLFVGLKSEAEKRNIYFQLDFYYPTGTSVNAFDVSVILNNALQNAMENVEKSETPHISVPSYRSNNAYMIEISNSFTGNLQWDEESGLPVTSKEKRRS